jgi:hypothetical protein
MDCAIPHIDVRAIKSRPDFPIIAIWVAATEEEEGTELSDAQFWRFVKRVPDITRDLLKNLSEIPFPVDYVQTVWNHRIRNPRAINTYRSFLKRLELKGVDNSRELLTQFILDQKPLSIGQQLNLCDLAVFVKKLPFTMGDFRRVYFENGYSFGPGVTSDRHPDKIGPRMARIEKLRYLDVDNLLARVSFVPKDWKGQRLITPCPAWLVLQQSQIANALVHAIQNFCTVDNPTAVFMNGFWQDEPYQAIALRGRQAQEPNRKRCNLAYDTLDLSRASDLVKRVHVQLCFEVEWRILLSKTRVRRLTISDSLFKKLESPAKDMVVKEKGLKIVDLKQTFAPMGSKLTFPTETYTFLALTRAILAKAGAPLWVILGVIVFGDDILVPHGWGKLVAEALNSIGFKVNMSKSFWEGPYRETCGFETLWNRDVRPIRLPHGATLEWFSRLDQSGRIDFARRLDELGLYVTQAVFVNLCRIDADLKWEGFYQRMLSQPREGRSPRMPGIFPIPITHDFRYSTNLWVRDEDASRTTVQMRYPTPTGSTLMPLMREFPPGAIVWPSLNDYVYGPLSAECVQLYKYFQKPNPPRRVLSRLIREITVLCSLDKRYADVVTDYLLAQVGSDLEGTPVLCGDPTMVCAPNGLAYKSIGKLGDILRSLHVSKGRR